MKMFHDPVDLRIQGYSNGLLLPEKWSVKCQALNQSPACGEAGLADFHIRFVERDAKVGEISFSILPGIKISHPQ
jgi:hypothetical protein